MVVEIDLVNYFVCYWIIIGIISMYVLWIGLFEMFVVMVVMFGCLDCVMLGGS